MSKTLITEMSEHIANGLSVEDACLRCGVSKAWHYKMQLRGQTEASGPYRDYADAIAAARSHARRPHLDAFERVVINRASENGITIKTKHTRIVKLPPHDELLLQEALERHEALRERFEAEGVLFKEEVERITVGPDAQLAFKMLDGSDEAFWKPDEVTSGSVTLPDPNRAASAWLDELFGNTALETQRNYQLAEEFLVPRSRNAKAIAKSIVDAVHKQIIVSGPVGTGKTSMLCAILHGLCVRYPGFKVLCVRNEFSTMRTSLMENFKSVLAHRFQKTPENPFTAYGGEEKPERLIYKNGSQLDFHGMDNVDKLRSADYHVVFFSEVHRFHDTVAFGDLAKRLRGKNVGWTRALDASEEGQEAQHKFILLGDCNPSTPDHMLKNAEAEGKLLMLKTTLEDNASFHDGDAFTTEGARYKAHIEETTPPGFSYSRDVLGEWVAASGLVYPMFNPEKHVNPFTPDDIPSDWTFASCLDFGYHCLAYGLHAHPPDNPNIAWVCGAIYGGGMTTDELWQWIEALHQRWRAPMDIVCIADHDRTESEALRRRGLNVRRADKRDSLAGIDKMKRYLMREPPAFRFNPELRFNPEDAERKARGMVTEPMREFSRYVYNTAGTSPERADYPVKSGNEHYMDALKYYIATYMIESQPLYFSVHSRQPEEFGIRS